MALVTHLVLTKQLGENATTPRDPVAAVERVEGTTAYLKDGGEVDLTSTTSCCASSDWDMLVSVDLYGVTEVTLPEWLSVDEWLRNTTKWKWTWGCEVDPSWPEEWQRRLADLGTARRLGCAKLLRVKNFRSSFRASLRRQLESWLNGESDHDSPFSWKQWDCVVNGYIAREAKCLDNSLYWRRGFADATTYAA